MFRLSSWVLLMKLFSGECHRIPLMISQHWFRWWLGAIRHQAITWANVDPVLYHHMASFGHSELINIHYKDIIISLKIVYSTIYSGIDQRKHQSSASLVFVRGIHWWLVHFLHKGPVTRKMFPFDDPHAKRYLHSIIVTELEWLIPMLIKDVEWYNMFTT